jgi:uncharacterized membrane protein YqjE
MEVKPEKEDFLCHKMMIKVAMVLMAMVVMVMVVMVMKM